MMHRKHNLQLLYSIAVSQGMQSRIPSNVPFMSSTTNELAFHRRLVISSRLGK